MEDKPIIESLLDLDFYKFTMGQVVFKKYRGTKVKYRLIDRHNRKLGLVIPIEKIREQLEYIKTLRISRSELHYLRGTNEYSDRMFAEDYLEHLDRMRLPDFELGIEPSGELRLEVYGSWESAIYWETLIMSVVSELYAQECIKDFSKLELNQLFSIGYTNLNRKVNLLNPEIAIAEFGTRRRFSFYWQKELLENLLDCRNVKLTGTSNTKLAQTHDLIPIGTCAHEEEMGVAGLSYSNLIAAHNRVLNDWWGIYGYGLSIALTDTYTSDFFYSNFGEQRARDWKGVRHDSGDPLTFGIKTLEFYKSYGIDPRKKLIIFSDGLTIDSILHLHSVFKNKIALSFGWGTNLVNDVGITPLAIVMKMVESNGNPVVKLSDNPEKTIGDEAAIKKYKKTFITERKELLKTFSWYNIDPSDPA